MFNDCIEFFHQPLKERDEVKSLVKVKKILEELLMIFSLHKY